MQVGVGEGGLGHAELFFVWRDSPSRSSTSAHDKASRLLTSSIVPRTHEWFTRSVRAPLSLLALVGRVLASDARSNLVSMGTSRSPLAEVLADIRDCSQRDEGIDEDEGIEDTLHADMQPRRHRWVDGDVGPLVAVQSWSSFEHLGSV